MSDRKRKKKYFQAGAKKPKTHYNRPILCPGMRGFIVTTNDKPFQTVKEALNIIQEYYERSQPDKKAENPEEEDSDEDISASVQREKEQMKSRKDFYEAETGAKNVMFVATGIPTMTPSNLVQQIFSRTKEGGDKTCRYIQKLYPVDLTCRAYRDDLKKAAPSLIDAHFKDSGLSYEIVFRARINNKMELSRTDVLETIPELVKAVSPLSRVNLNEPDRTIIVEVIKNVCCLAVVTDFKKFRKMNLHELCKPSKAEAEALNEACESAEVTESTTQQNSAQPIDNSLDLTGEKIEKPVSDTPKITSEEELVKEDGSGVEVPDVNA